MKNQIVSRYYRLLATMQTPSVVDKFFRRYSIAAMSCIMVLCFVSFAFGDTTGSDLSGEGVFAAATSMFSELYKAIAGISTAAAVVAEAVAACLYFFSSNGRTVEQAQDWMKRIGLGWLIINGMGAIVVTAEKLISGMPSVSF